MKKIMIVEDEPDILDIIKLTLDFGSYQLLTATDGDQALETARRELPDLILLDIMLPGSIDGLDVCRRLRGDEATKDTYVMMVTAKGMERDKEAGIQAGCDEYVVKPFKIMQLMKSIEAILGE
ncbi:MAG: response regulator [Anaerolineales bacterium]|nr:response regulator [Chloroflexota bacterium]MBL6983734.1 response regulator [Anaerolineales bacterium]